MRKKLCLGSIEALCLGEPVVSVRLLNSAVCLCTRHCCPDFVLLWAVGHKRGNGNTADAAGLRHGGFSSISLTFRSVTLFFLFSVFHSLLIFDQTCDLFI